jgi:hypothetical protein
MGSAVSCHTEWSSVWAAHSKPYISTSTSSKVKLSFGQATVSVGRGQHAVHSGQLPGRPLGCDDPQRGTGLAGPFDVPVGVADVVGVEWVYTIADMSLSVTDSIAATTPA